MFKNIVVFALVLTTHGSIAIGADDAVKRVHFSVHADASCPSGYAADDLATPTSEAACLDADLAGLRAFAGQGIGLVEDLRGRVRSFWSLIDLTAIRPPMPATTVTPVIEVRLEKDTTCPSGLAARPLAAASSEDLAACAMVDLQGLRARGDQEVTAHLADGTMRPVWRISHLELDGA